MHVHGGNICKGVWLPTNKVPFVCILQNQAQRYLISHASQSPPVQRAMFGFTFPSMSFENQFQPSAIKGRPFHKVPVNRQVADVQISQTLPSV